MASSEDNSFICPMARSCRGKTLGDIVPTFMNAGYFLFRYIEVYFWKNSINAALYFFNL